MAATRELGPCLVARLTPFRDADLILSLLSADHGRVDAIARGARSSRRRFGGAMRLFCEVNAAVQGGRGSLPVLSQADVQRVWLQDEVGYDQLCFASYLTELALVASQPDHADADLYDWLCGWLTITQLGVSGHVRSLRLAAEVTFLHVMGLFPDVRSCHSCGCETSAGAAWPDPTEGLLCGECAGDAGPVIAPDMLLALAVLISQPEPAIELARSLPVQTLRPVEDRVARLLARVLPSTLRSSEALRTAVRDDLPV